MIYSDLYRILPVRVFVYVPPSNRTDITKHNPSPCIHHISFFLSFKTPVLRSPNLLHKQLCQSSFLFPFRI